MKKITSIIFLISYYTITAYSQLISDCRIIHNVNIFKNILVSQNQFNSNDVGKYVVFEKIKPINYSVNYIVTTVSQRNQLVCPNLSKILVTNTIDPRYPNDIGQQTFLKVGNEFQLLEKYETVSHQITQYISIDSVIIDNLIITPIINFSIKVGTNNTPHLQTLINSQNNIAISKGSYLFIFDSLTSSINLKSNRQINGNNSTFYCYTKKEYYTGSFSFLLIQQNDTTKNNFIAAISNLNIISNLYRHHLKETQPPFYCINWINGQGSLKLDNILIKGFFGGINSTGDCLGTCIGIRNQSYSNVNIDSIYGVGIGLFGRLNYLQSNECHFSNIGVDRKWTLNNSEYGQGVYLHRSNNFSFQNCIWENIKTHAIVPYSSGVDWQERCVQQAVDNCVFINVSGSVQTDPLQNKFIINNSIFDNCQIIIAGGCLINNCIFTNRTSSAITTSSGSSQQSQFYCQISNCKFKGQQGYAINIEDTQTKSQNFQIDNCSFEMVNGTGIQNFSSNLTTINNCIFSGVGIRSIYNDGTGLTFLNNSYFFQTGLSRTIVVNGISQFRGINNSFLFCSIQATGTGTGFLKNSTFLNTPEFIITNPNFMVN